MRRGNPSSEAAATWEERMNPRVSRAVPSVCPDSVAGVVEWRESSRRCCGLMCGKKRTQSSVHRATGGQQKAQRAG